MRHFRGMGAYLARLTARASSRMTAASFQENSEDQDRCCIIPGSSLNHAKRSSQADLDAAHSGRRERADIRPYFVVIDRLDIVTGNPASHYFLWPQRHHGRTLGLRRCGSQPSCDYLLERPVAPVV